MLEQSFGERIVLAHPVNITPPLDFQIIVNPETFKERDIQFPYHCSINLRNLPTMDSPFSISTNTPSRSTSSSRPNSANKNTRASNSKSKSSSYTPLKQDQQARNKEPDDDNYDDESSDEDLTGASYDLFGNESYISVQIRREAVAVLDNPELLMMHAAARNDSIPSTRLYFLQRLSGRPETPAQEKKAAEDRLAQLKKLAKKRDLADAETSSGSTSKGEATKSDKQIKMYAWESELALHL
ncbi:hypothetical protein BPAE_0044g00460 [Botrytis paeoniae]|uniref:Uncharacterized protein n=1 Tax=Botrytis paeoniae TaxID=278948 RepID=A0A4Z1FZV3_9HELO|nr:hypothetical protein BPAE_0044g00460 [Botrytis paeoniae]